MPDDITAVAYPVFAAVPEALTDDDREAAAKEAEEFFERASGRVRMRGAYSISGMRADADVMLWWLASSVDALQDLYVAFRKTLLGRVLEPVDAFVGLVLPAEFAPDHKPAFAEGKAPKRYVSAYPFVRTPEWYLLEPERRGALLREHGEAGREFPDVLANTTSAFGLGDYEWILAFEADEPQRLVQLIRRLRATEARLYTKVEVPFYSGIRRSLTELVAQLP